MRLPRDLSGYDLARALGVLGHEIRRQTGSHMRLITQEHEEHHVTVSKHSALRVNTLASILGDAAQHFEMTREELLERIFGRHG